jgi:uncharacterized cupredoxin-like copper-binding protein
MLGLCVVGLACVGLVAVLLGYRTGSAAGQERAAEATVVTVIAGKPSEFAFTLSKSSALPWQAKPRSGTVTFKVTNRGALSHQFKVCTTPVTSARLITCSGTGTKVLKPGQSATLTIIFKKRGTYEYLSNVPGQAAKGMKGLIGIGVTVPRAATTTTPSTTSTPSTTTAPSTTTTPSTPTTPSSTAPTGDPVAGAAVWVSAGCSSCHTIGEARGNVGPDLNLTHPGAFNNGPLTPTQISDLAAYVNSSTR